LPKDYIIHQLKHLEEKIDKLIEITKKKDKNMLLSLVLILWMTAPIAFFSVPLIGLINILGAIWATIVYLKFK